MDYESSSDTTGRIAASRNMKPVQRNEYTASPWIMALQAYRTTFHEVWGAVVATLGTGIGFAVAACNIAVADYIPVVSTCFVILCVIIFRFNDGMMLNTMTSWNRFSRPPIRLRIGLISLFAWCTTICATITIWTMCYLVPSRNLDHDFLIASAKAEAAVRGLKPGDFIIMANGELRLTVAPAQWMDSQFYNYNNCPLASAENADIAEVAATMDRIIKLSDPQWESFSYYYLTAEKCPVRI